jgi:hypothetical protein
MVTSMGELSLPVSTVAASAVASLESASVWLLASSMRVPEQAALATAVRSVRMASLG